MAMAGIKVSETVSRLAEQSWLSPFQGTLGAFKLKFSSPREGTIPQRAPAYIFNSKSGVDVRRRYSESRETMTQNQHQN